MSADATIRIGDRLIGPGQPTYVIAEMSGNHGGHFDRAVELIRAARDAGADAVKLQTYTPDTLTIPCDNEYFRISGTLWEGRTLYELYDEAHTPWEWQPRLKEEAERLGLSLFSTAFDDTAVEFLERMNVPAYKIASFENVDLPLLRRVAATGKPLIVSTGMASLSELDEVVRTIRGAGAREIALLKCTSAYPAAPHSMNLRTIPHLARTFGVLAGLSDHTLKLAVPVAAVTLGASIVEKHLTLSRKEPGPDNEFSLEPEEFREMVRAVRITEEALGTVQYGASAEEQESMVFRRSLFVVEDVHAGEIFTDENVRAIRPGFGLHTRHLPDVLGRRANRDVSRGTPMSWELVGAPPL